MPEKSEDRFAALRDNSRGGSTDGATEARAADRSESAAPTSDSSDDPTGTPDDNGADGADEATETDETAETDERNDGTTESPSEADGGPAFPFDNEMRRSIYVRESTWQALEDAVDFDVQRTLRERGVRDLTGRETHDAMVRLAAENPDALTRIVLEARGLDEP